MLEKIEVDPHTHTVLSGHAWSTLAENAAHAAAIGLRAFCLTEHGPAIVGGAIEYVPAAQIMLPGVICGVKVYKGTEANIVDYDGNLDIAMVFMKRTEFAVASIHDMVLTSGGVAKNTSAILGAINHPYIDMPGHIDDPRLPSDYEAIVIEAGKLGKLIEINNNSLLVRKGSDENIRKVANFCKRHSVRVAVSSDAHYMTMVGDVAPSLKLLAEENFPDELIINRTAESFESYLAERERRLGGIA